MSPPAGQSALVLLVPPAEALVGRWRAAHDPSASDGMPAHITVLYPFVAAAELTDETIRALTQLCERTEPLAVSFAGFGHFPSVLWLDPGSPACVDFLKAVHRRWPHHPPYGRTDLAVVPHLTVTDGADASTNRTVEDDLAGKLPLDVEIEALHLMVFDGRRWTPRHRFGFVSSDGPSRPAPPEPRSRGRRRGSGPRPAR